ncbi:hypothetical protein [Roseomonas sp. CECT 9278]|uniref:hypothetical protein n=1 Tax=Roseomonas sp. CECT 9278 TaxID=2845823 RepID=UPI001E5FCCD1|nr:hypothetical protein [Roseomonas sp. CECT 9278]CAH0224026.1 hypothetical protein ROS9278_02481 [Roseomonas sp. CECT 9278]
MTLACLWLALLLLAVPLRAETIAIAPPGGGACRIHAAPPGTHAAERAALETEATRIAAFAARLLADAAAMRLGPAREGVPGFGDWAYGWVQSYVTSYRILLRGMTGLARSVTTEDEAPLTTRIAEEMAEPLRAEFRARVLAPALDGGSFAADLAHVGAAVDAAWTTALAASAARIAALPHGAGVPSHRLDLDAAGAALTPGILATAPADPMALLAEDGADGSTVFLRSMRPMAARLGAVAVRLSEAGSLVAAGGGLGFAMAGVPGTLIGLTGGIGASWAIDWLLNRLDASLNRAAFESQAIEAIGRAERHLAQGAAAVVEAALRRRLEVLGTEIECR